MTEKEQPTAETSLVPLIRAEETRLAEELAQTKSQVQTLITDAKRSAQQRIEKARLQIPEVIGQTRSREIQNLNAQTLDRENLAQQQVVILEEQARQNLPAAVQHILTLVLPEDMA